MNNKNYGYKYTQLNSNVNIITARKRSLRRLCFYTCLSVILFTRGGGFSTPTPGGGWGVWPGGSPGSHPGGGRLGGSGHGGSPGPHPGGEVEGSGQGSPGPHPKGGWGVWLGGVQVQTQGVYPSMHWGRHPPQQTATAAGSTHPTGMHYSIVLIWFLPASDTSLLVQSGGNCVRIEIGGLGYRVCITLDWMNYHISGNVI